MESDVVVAANVHYSSELERGIVQGFVRLIGIEGGRLKEGWWFVTLRLEENIRLQREALEAAPVGVEEVSEEMRRT